MKTNTMKTLSAAIALTLTAGINAAPKSEPIDLLLPKQVDTSIQAPQLLNKSREAVSFSWVIKDAYAPNPLSNQASTAESTEYWQTVTGAELNKGIQVNTTAPGALVRISERSRTTATTNSSQKIRGIQPLDLEVMTPAGVKLGNGTAMASKASPQQMRDAGSPFPNGTAAFKLKESLGSGSFTLRNSKAISPNTEFVLHVFDKQSNQRLSLTREQSRYMAGNVMKLHGDLADNYAGMNISSIKGFVTSPSGVTAPMTIKKGANGQFTTEFKLSNTAEFGGLYEAYVDASSISNGNEIKRRVKTAFAVVNATAKIRQATAGTVNYGLPVSLQVKDAGRFELRGILYGTDQQGSMVPFMASSTAQWLERGNKAMTLSFDQSIVSASGLQAPYELRDLQLIDQSRMGNLQVLQKSIGISGVAQPLPTMPQVIERTPVTPVQRSTAEADLEADKIAAELKEDIQRAQILRNMHR